MADHVTEEQQVEAIKKWWKENGIAVIAGLVIGFGALYGWRYWNETKADQAAEASLQYGIFQVQLKQGNVEAKQSGDKIISEYTATPYAVLAAFELAKYAIEKNDLAEAKARLQWVLDNTRQAQMKHTAQLRLAAVVSAEGDFDAALGLLNVDAAGGYKGAYAEMRGDVLVAKGDLAAAHAAYDLALQTDGLSPGNREVVEAKRADTQPGVMQETAEATK